jgi:hypothetical protein
LRIRLDKNVPVGVRRFLSRHDVRTFVDMNWDSQLENGVLLKEAEAAGFDAAWAKTGSGPAASSS